ncbi:hypothetical protein QUF72_20345 [Desulfobacterales bacterium HSG2]|nr:hypothetical protein [Desulfobacterales bacterium HSG2]
MVSCDFYKHVGPTGLVWWYPAISTNMSALRASVWCYACDFSARIAKSEPPDLVIQMEREGEPSCQERESGSSPRSARIAKSEPSDLAIRREREGEPPDLAIRRERECESSSRSARIGKSEPPDLAIRREREVSRRIWQSAGSGRVSRRIWQSAGSGRGKFKSS